MAVGLSRRRQRRSALAGLVLITAVACGVLQLWPAALAVVGSAAVDADEEATLGEKLSPLVSEYAGSLAVLASLACIFLAMEDNPRPPPAPVPVEKRPDFLRVCVLSAILCAVSGMVNAVAILEMTGTVAHQTGNTSHFGRLLGIDGLRFGVLLLTFTLGAGVAGFTKADGEALFQRRYCPCLMSAAFGTAVGALLQWVSGRGNWVTLPFWAFAQGIQNGVTSRFSSMPLRTTHHTGTMTDAGATLGLWLRAKLHGDPTPDLRKTWLLLLCLFSYAAGGVAAKVGVDSCGILAALPPALVMALLATGVLPLAADASKKAA